MFRCLFTLLITAVVLYLFAASFSGCRTKGAAQVSLAGGEGRVLAVRGCAHGQHPLPSFSDTYVVSKSASAALSSSSVIGSIVTFTAR
jgi:hypothetical protein